MKKLYRSTENRIVAGVIGGIGDYFNVDPVVLRLVWVFVVIFTGFFPGVLCYIIAIFIIPLEHETRRATGSRELPLDIGVLN